METGTVLELIKLQKVATVKHVQLLETVLVITMPVTAIITHVVDTIMHVVVIIMLVVHIHIHAMLLEIDIAQPTVVLAMLWLDHLA